MRRINVLLLLLSMFAMTALTESCKKDSCTPPAIETNIIGTWNVSKNDGGMVTTGQVTINSNGTYSDTPGDLMLSDYTIKTWEVGEFLGSKFITFASTDGFALESSGMVVQSNECNKIVLDDFGTSFTLTK